MEKNKCSVLVTSCDAYCDAWNPFFELFNIMWPDCKYPVFLNTETKEYKNKKIDVQVLHPTSITDKKGKPISWSRRLKETVSQIESKYILFFLEDFFLMSPVRKNIVEKCIEYMDKDNDIAVFEFYPDYHEDDIVFEEFSHIHKKYDFVINTMAALWRKDFLINILRDENPWEFEYFATGRWKKTKAKIYTHRDMFPPVFDYKIKPEYGYGIYKGKWLRKNPELFSKYGISVDFEKRGFTDPPCEIARKRERHWLVHDFINTIKHPSLFVHYYKCLVNIIKSKNRKIKIKYFNK